MIVTCPTCATRYDDESRWTVCPHNSLNVAHDTPYCRRHDLYNCQVCKQLAEGREAMKGEPRRPVDLSRGELMILRNALILAFGNRPTHEDSPVTFALLERIEETARNGGLLTESECRAANWAAYERWMDGVMRQGGT